MGPASTLLDRSLMQATRDAMTAIGVPMPGGFRCVNSEGSHMQTGFRSHHSQEDGGGMVEHQHPTADHRTPTHRYLRESVRNCLVRAALLRRDAAMRRSGILNVKRAPIPHWGWTATALVVTAIAAADRDPAELSGGSDGLRLDRGDTIMIPPLVRIRSFAVRDAVHLPPGLPETMVNSASGSRLSQWVALPPTGRPDVDAAVAALIVEDANAGPEATALLIDTRTLPRFSVAPVPTGIDDGWIRMVETGMARLEDHLAAVPF